MSDVTQGDVSTVADTILATPEEAKQPYEAPPEEEAPKSDAPSDSEARPEVEDEEEEESSSTEAPETEEDEDDESYLFDTPDEEPEVAPDDDMKVKFKVDGEEREVTLSELKRLAAGEGAIEKRLQEVTENRKEVAKQVATNRDQMARMIQAFGTIMFTPQTEAPDPNLAQQNPAQYIALKEAHEREIAHLNKRKEYVEGMFTDLAQQQEQHLAHIRAAEAAILQRKLPILADNEKGPKFREALVQTAKEAYGFTDDEISAALTHKVFLMAADAMRYRKLMAKGKVNVPEKTKARVLPKKSAPNPGSIASKQQRAARKRAMATGSIDDVAMTMVAPKRARRK